MSNKLDKLDINELQAQLQALCYKIIGVQAASLQDMRRYEELLAEIFRRGETPKMTLSPKD